MKTETSENLEVFDETQRLTEMISDCLAVENKRYC